MWSNNIKNVNLDGKYPSEKEKKLDSDNFSVESMLFYDLSAELEDVLHDIEVLRDDLINFVYSMSMDADAVCSLAREIEEAEDKRLNILTRINELQQGSW